jgi:hypothetical protein
MGMCFRPMQLIAMPLMGAALLFACAGCQLQSSVSGAGLIEHQSMLDWSGLGESETIEAVKVNAAIPQKWTALAPRRTSNYVNAQWRSPSQQTGVGVAYVHLPLPLPTSMLVWLAKKEYAKRGQDGQVLGQWTDTLGRSWFEAQNDKYHIRGYVVSKGLDVWFIYCGYKRTDDPPSAAELGVAGRSLETIVPTPVVADLPRRPVALTTLQDYVKPSF